MRIKGKISLVILVSLLSTGCSCSSKKEIHIHNYSKDWYYDSTNHFHKCTVEGCDQKSILYSHIFDEDGYCIECGYLKGDSISTIDSCDHDWSAWEIVDEPTCIDKGVRERICYKCGKLYSKSIDYDLEYGHSYVSDPDSDFTSTCIGTGISGSLRCMLCNEKKKGQISPALGHSLVNTEVLKTGITKSTCDSCNAIVYELDIESANGWNKPNSVMSATSGTNSGSTWSVRDLFEEGIYDIQVYAKLASKEHSDRKWYNMAKQDLCVAGVAEDTTNRYDRIEHDDYRYVLLLDNVAIRPNIRQAWGDLGYNDSEYNYGLMATEFRITYLSQITFNHSNTSCPLYVSKIVLYKY